MTKVKCFSETPIRVTVDSIVYKFQVTGCGTQGHIEKHILQTLGVPEDYST